MLIIVTLVGIDCPTSPLEAPAQATSLIIKRLEPVEDEQARQDSLTNIANV